MRSDQILELNGCVVTVHGRSIRVSKGSNAWDIPTSKVEYIHPHGHTVRIDAAYAKKHNISN